MTVAAPREVALTVVVPCYRSAASLPELVRRLAATLEDAVAAFEVILVVDASPDETGEVARGLAGAHPFVRTIELSRNFGQHSALLCGIRAARHELVVTMDDDLQHRPEDIPALVDAVCAGADLAYGNGVEEEHGGWRNLSSRLAKIAMAASVGGRTARIVTAFRCFRTWLRNGFTSVDDPYVSIDVLLSWTTTRVVAVPVRMEQRRYGRSSYTLRKLLRHAVNMLTGYSLAPLRFVTYMGVTLFLFGTAVLLYVLATYVVSGESLPGFPFLASLISIFSGAQLLALGIIGEYLGRLHFRSMRKPAYLVRPDGLSSVTEPGTDQATSS